MKLLLSPPSTLAQPSGWKKLPAVPHHLNRCDEVHCIGGGTLLLWLLVKAGRAPRCNQIVVHGRPALPSPTGVEPWLADLSQSEIDAHEWRKQAVALGVGGALTSDEAWLRPILLEMAMGRFEALEEDLLSYAARWESAGRLRYSGTNDEARALESVAAFAGGSGVVSVSHVAM